MLRKKVLFVLMLILTIMSVALFLSGCNSSPEKTLVNDAKVVFSGIEETTLTEYLEATPLTAASNDSYLKSNNVTIEMVKEKLAMSSDVIPFTGETGGTPYIVMESIQLIGDQWIYCNAEDGHMSADLLVKFVVDDKGNIEFKACAMDINESGTYVLEEVQSISDSTE